MIAAAEPTREVFWGFSHGLELLWYALAGFSVLVFAFGVARPLAKYRRGRGHPLPPLREWPRRFARAGREIAGQAMVGRRDRLAGWAHRGIFWGFVVLLVGTIVLAINTDVTERFFGWRFFQGDFYLAYSLTLDVLGIALLAGLLAMMLRRAVLRPAKLDYARPDREPGEPGYDRRRYRWGDWVFVGGLLYLVVTGYALEGVRIAMEGGAYGWANPVGWATGQAIDAAGLSAGALDALRHASWWLHGLVALALVAAIPYTKAAHMLADVASLAFRDPLAGRRMRTPPGGADAPTGYAALRDFSPAHLLQLDACTKCGRCHEACPALATGHPLSPRDVVLELREQANAAQAATGVGGVLGPLLHRRGNGAGDGPFAAPVIGHDGVRAETVWACLACNACVEACPVGIEQAPIIGELRRGLVEAGELPADLGRTLRTIAKSGNSFGESRRRRGRWAAELEVPLKDAREEPVDVLWFVGDFASFDPRSQEVSRTIARLLQAAGVDVGILFDGERTAGNDVRRAGEEGLWEALAAENVAAIEACSFERIMTSDPHSLNTLRNEYPDAGGRWTVVHHTELLLELVEAGRLPVSAPLGRRVTYHDPCHLGRLAGEYEAPRRLIAASGCELAEMPRNRDASFCCGAGGGRIWIRDEPGVRRPSEERIDEALGVGGVELFVVACPKDVTMYEDAIKTSGHEGEIELREVSELLAEAVLGAPAGLAAGAEGPAT